MSTDQYQHYLPRSYQRGWANAAGKVHVYQCFNGKVVCKPKSTKSTGGERGLYYSPMAPADQRNRMENEFWQKIDQWGADQLSLLRSVNSDALAKVNKERLIIFILSLVWRNPKQVAILDQETKNFVKEGILKDAYDFHRRQHEPSTFEEFEAMLNLPGISELGARILRLLVYNEPIRRQLLEMNWQIVTVDNSEPILTSDSPVIRHKALKDDDGMLILPTSPTEFFVAFNENKIDMKNWITQSIQAGTFVAGINKYLVKQKIKYVYGIDDSHLDFVTRHWKF